MTAVTTDNSDDSATPPIARLLDRQSRLPRNQLSQRLVGTQEVLRNLTNAERNHKHERLKLNTDAIDKWFKSNRKSKKFAAPAVLLNNGKLTEWIPTYCDALVDLLPGLPFALDSLRLLSKTVLLEFGSTINSQSQLRLIQQHAGDLTIPKQVRIMCTK